MARVCNHLCEVLLLVLLACSLPIASPTFLPSISSTLTVDEGLDNIGDTDVVTIVDCVGLQNQVRLAVMSAAGLRNRHGPSTYFYSNADDDPFWLKTLEPERPRQTVPWQDFLSDALSEYGAIVYSSAPAQNTLLPSVATCAGVLSAIPIDEETLYPLYPSTRIVLNTIGLWASPADAVQWTSDNYLQNTTGLAIQNPEVLKSGFLSDFIVGKKLFVQYLKKQCLPFYGQRSELRRRIEESPWSVPVRVYGYNSNDVLFGGDVFEAETDCVNLMGQVASSHVNNLMYWSQVRPFDPTADPGTPSGPMVQTSNMPTLTYNASKTYVTLVYGDMDNLDFVFGFAHHHMQYRAKHCAPDRNCFPFVWTLSPNLVQDAPAVLRWYYELGKSTGRDWFIMPPSGTLYAYPGVMPLHVQEDYVSQQTEHARYMDTTGTIHWEWMFTWGRAWIDYFPRYVGLNRYGKCVWASTRFFFLNDVPWKVPIPGLSLFHQHYRWVGPRDADEGVVGFKPAFNWQENGASGGDPGNSTHIAGRINKLAIGSIHYVYIIQNTPIESVFDMVEQLDDHIVLVEGHQLADLAAQHREHHHDMDDSIEEAQRKWMQREMKEEGYGYSP